jgi:hypothetical protein
MLVDALTVFLGAFLLFQIQPLIGKYLLPWFGGGPAVWTTCLLFFQLMLLAGYLYAHGLARRLPPKAARALHVALVALSLATLAVLAFAWGSPILPGPDWKPMDSSSPVERILLLLAMSIGLPYLLLSSTSPLVQAWASRRHPRIRVYRLYALSNLGSLLALVTYPPIVERLLPLRVQAWAWSWTYVAFAAGSLACASRAAERTLALEPAETAEPAATDAAGPTRLPYGFWFALSACGSMMLLATTNQMCQEVAAIPFLWILPLCLYLLTFIVCFESERLYVRSIFGPALAAALGWAALVLFRGYVVPIRTQIAAYSAALLAACMVCHGELARSKPRPGRLTSFYLTIAAGGAAGGIFVALVAPRIFRAFWEIHLALFLSGLVAIVALARDRGSWLRTGRPWPAFLALVAAVVLNYHARDPELFSSGWPGLREAFSSGGGLLALGGGVAALLLLLRLRVLTAPRRPYFAGACLAGALVLLGALLATEIREFLSSAVSLSRNFYGVLTVERINEDDPELARLDLRHGRIVHGFQYESAEKRREPTTYYGEESGIGVLLRHHPRRAAGPMRIGVVGLGVGTIAAYGRPGDTLRFYEINPGVIALSTGPRALFTYVRDSPARVEIVVGDARLSFERELARRSTQTLDVIAVDAFSSDAIPVHLLTKEALEIYLARLARPDGVLALHISNRQLDLEPVVRALAGALHLSMCVVDRKGTGDAVWGTTWILLAPDGKVLETAQIAAACARRGDGSRVRRVWTDDYSNLVEVMK